MRFLPQRITSRLDPELAQLVNDILAVVRRITPRSSPSVRVNESANGTTYEVITRGGGGGSSTGSVNYKGTFDATKTYSKGDIVRVQTGTSQGIWICVVDNLAAGTAPVFPEPVTIGGINSWDMFNFGVQASVDCQNGNKTIYINASAPIT